MTLTEYLQANPSRVTTLTDHDLAHHYLAAELTVVPLKSGTDSLYVRGSHGLPLLIGEARQP